MIINPYREDVFGFENQIVLEHLIVIMRAIVDGVVLPKVKMTKSEEGRSFELIYPGKENLAGCDGGHHRVFAFFLLGRDLEIDLIDRSSLPFQDFCSLVSLKGIVPSSKPEDFAYQRRVDKNVGELPSVEEMFGKYVLIVNSLKYGCGIVLNPDLYNRILDSQK